jgi:hypothetical protein
MAESGELESHPCGRIAFQASPARLSGSLSRYFGCPTTAALCDIISENGYCQLEHWPDRAAWFCAVWMVVVFTLLALHAMRHSITSMKMHSPGHSSAASMTAFTRRSGTCATPSAIW